jgi:hypothetical protein
MPACTGKSFSEAVILASTNPQYDKRLFMELPCKNYKHFCPRSALVVFTVIP